MRVLLIDDTTRAMIERAKAEAFADPLTKEEIAVMTLPPQDKDRYTLAEREGASLPKKAISIDIVAGYHANVAFEEQEAGLCMHLSIRVDTPGHLPSPEAFMLIAQAFGIHLDKAPVRVWFDEFAPGHEAINVVVLVENTDAVKDLSPV